MAKNSNNKAALKKAFKEDNLSANRIGAYYEFVVSYRGYYLDASENAHWAGPWRNDSMAAAMDTFPYAQQGFQTGVRMKQT